MNKRKHVRHEIQHHATMLMQDGVKLGCEILNFSLGGLYIIPEDKNWFSKIGSRLQPKTYIAIQVVTPRGAQGASITAQAMVTHTSSSGLGLAFASPENELLDYLYRLSKNAEKEGFTPTRQTASGLGTKETSIANWVHAQIRQYLEAKHSEFIQKTYDALFESANNAESNQDQRMFYDTLTTLKKNEANILGAYLSNINNSFSGFKNGTSTKKSLDGKQSEQQGLELVAKEDFEEWVAVVSLTRNLDQKVASKLHKLENALSYLSNSYISNESNPISPYSLLWSLKKALSNYDIKLAPKQILFSSFNETVLGDTANFYESVNSYLEKQGVSVQNQERTPPQKRPKTLSSSSREKRLSDRLSSVLGLANKKGRGRKTAATQAGTAPRKMVVDTLRDISTSGGRPIVQRIEEKLVSEVIDGRPATIDDKTRDAIQVSENLLDSLQEDFSVTPKVQDLINGLKLPFIKETINDPNLLNDNEHPGHRLLEAIGKLSPFIQTGDDTRAEKGYLFQALEEINRLTEKGADLDIQDITGHIENLIDHQRQEFENNLELVTNSCEHDEKFSDVQNQVTEILCDKLTKCPIPTLIEELLHLGWPAALMNALSAPDSDTESVDSLVQVLDSLVSIFGTEAGYEKTDPADIKKLMHTISKGLSIYPLHHEAALEFTNMLHEFFDSEGELNSELAQEESEIDETAIRKIVDKQSTKQPREKPDISVEQSWLDLVSNIKLDDWIVEQRKQGHVRMLNLAWMNPPATRYVFVDGEGKKSLDADKNQLANLFKENQCSLLEDGDVPIVERTVNRLLKNTFDQIKQDSDTDELTGLLGRKGFQRKLSELLDLSTDIGDTHIMLELDIDRFSVINDLCGFRGGDKLLETMAKILKNYQPEDSILARIGDDEFGMIIKNCSTENAYKIAETQRRALENLRYTWDGTTVPATASVGMVLITSETTNANKVLNQASDACRKAMKDGGNCTRLYQLSSDDIEKRKKLAQAVPMIEDALNNNKLALFAQPISPIFLGEGEDHHYEILMRIRGDDGNWHSPVEFIQAAEQYNRMRSVDRWVINNMFNWLENHHQELDGAGFSINLSGHTLDDESFPQFINNHLAKTSFPTDRLTLEITETSLVQHIDKAKILIEEIKSKGVKFSLDDFGTGYSSYSYLKDFPVDYVKIDGVFIRDILTESTSYAMVKSITEISHHMEKKVVAEYVENEGILVALRELEVDYAQGYGVGMPVPLKSLLKETAKI